MKKFKHLLFLVFISNTSIASNDCFPNLIKEDMCKMASEYAEVLNSAMPVKISNKSQMTSAIAEGNRIIITATLGYTRENLDSILYKSNIDNDAIFKEIQDTARAAVCQKQSNTRYFVRLGGIVEYDYIFNDGDIYTITTVKSCNY
ncbi:hypothetical protein [Yersinia kristensenii]|uniref:Uncharacterized protein n=1 Tax=Yersinia kristensenii TaxID=28152 RepID=A0A0T9L9I1_YERKR|nr:hypothetical protein [Yersinia kristensenii]CNE70597.1 Uncharacterised protein [Yersinia kristensenii]